MPIQGLINFLFPIFENNFALFFFSKLFLGSNFKKIIHKKRSKDFQGALGHSLRKGTSFFSQGQSQDYLFLGGQVVVLVHQSKQTLHTSTNIRVCMREVETHLDPSHVQKSTQPTRVGCVGLGINVSCLVTKMSFINYLNYFFLLNYNNSHA